MCLSAINNHTDKIQRLQERWLIRRAFDNNQDATLVAKSFRDIGVLLNVFLVNNPRLWEEMIAEPGIDRRWILSSMSKSKLRR